MFFNFCCSCPSRILIRSSLIRLIQTSAKQRAAKKCYYEVLGLQTDCTEKEIRNAFVTLSKECHPDRNLKNSTESGSADANKQFIQVMEAYQVLSKSHSRANYDLSMKGITSVNYVTRDTMHEPWKVDPTSYAEKGPNYSAYYGVKGLKRMSNWKIVCACIIFCAFGVMIQIVAITNSMTFKREQLDKFSAINSSKHEKAREAAMKYGNTEQLDRLKVRMLKSEIVYGDKDDV